MKFETEGVDSFSVSKRAPAINGGIVTKAATVMRKNVRLSKWCKFRRLALLMPLILIVVLFQCAVYLSSKFAPPAFSTATCPSATEDSLFGLPVEQLAANIRRSYERFNSVEVDQALRRERGPPFYVYGGPSAVQHPEDNIRTVKAKFLAYCSTLTDYTRLSALTAALAGIQLQCIGHGWSRFSMINRLAPVLGYLIASEESSYFEGSLDQLNDEDVLIVADTDIVYSADADMYNVVRAFASVTAHSAAEHERMTTRDPREAADSARWTWYTRDVRTGSALAPFIVNGENWCWLKGLPRDCDGYFREINFLHKAFVQQQKYYRERRGSGGASAGHAEGDYAAASEDTSDMFKLNSGFSLTRAWALRRVLFAAQNLVHTLPNCRQGECAYPIPGSPAHKTGAHRDDTNDQALVGLLYLRSRLQEYKEGGPLAIALDNAGADAAGTAAGILTKEQRDRLRSMTRDYDPLLESSFIPSGAPDTDGASLRLPHAMMMVDTHNAITRVIQYDTVWRKIETPYVSNASWPPAARHVYLYLGALYEHDAAMAGRFEERRRLTVQRASGDVSSDPSQLPSLARSVVGSLLNEPVVMLDPHSHTFACRADEAETNGTCSSLSFLRAVSLITPESPITFPSQNALVGTRPIPWHFPGAARRLLIPQYLYLLPQLYPLLNPLANHTRAACELARLTELLPPLRVWRLVGACGDVDAYRGGEDTERTVTEELIRRSTRELGCLPAAAPDLVPLGDFGKKVELLWAAAGRK